MSGKLKRAVRERIIVIRRIYWRMSFKIMGGVYALISLATLRHGNAIFCPGTWVYVGDVGYTETPECEDDLIIRVRCRNEERIRWDDIPVTVRLPKPVHNRFALSSDS